MLIYLLYSLKQGNSWETQVMEILLFPIWFIWLLRSLEADNIPIVKHKRQAVINNDTIYASFIIEGSQRTGVTF